MIKRLILFSVLLFPLLGVAQNTVINGQIHDPSNQNFASGTCSVFFRPTPGVIGPFLIDGTTTFNTQPSCTLDSGGNIAATATDNNRIKPSGSMWTITVCPNASAPCTTVNVPITGATFNVASSVNTAIPNIIVSPSVMPRAYSVSEIYPAMDGATFFNSSLGQIYNYFGGVWGQVSGSGGWGGSAIFPICTGVPTYNGGTAWGTTCYNTPTGNLIGDIDVQTLTNKTVDGISPSVFAFLAGITSDVQAQLNAKVGTGTTVNGHPLSANVTVTATDIGLGNVLNVAQEPALGNPSVNGYVLSSTTSGTRSWIPAASTLTGATINCVVTAASATTLQTAPNCPTTNSNGDINTIGNIKPGVGSTLAGFMGLPQGTTTGILANTIGFTSPASVTGYNLIWPATAGSGLVHWTNSSNSVTVSIGGANLASTDVNGILPVANGGTGTATPSLIGGNKIGISGTWPNQTVAVSGVVLPIKFFSATGGHNPAANATYYIGPIGGGAKTSNTTQTGYIVPQNCTLSKIIYHLLISGTVDTVAENATFRLTDNNTDITDTISNMVLNTAVTDTTITVSDALTAGHTIQLKVIFPNTVTTLPTSVDYGLDAYCTQ